MVGAAFSHYRITGKLGEGGMGVVYLAEDTLLEREVAIKFPSSGDGGGELERRLLREARAASALSHPHIAAVHDCGVHDGRPYVVMELVRGRGLGEILKSGPLPVARAAGIAAQVAEALAEAHGRNIVHRDIKPSNIRVAESGDVKVVDFGLARRLTADRKAAAETLTMEGAITGTPPYMAPEQVRGEAADGRADLFAAGAVLYECLTGRRAFEGANTIDTLSRVLSHDPPRPSELNPGVPEALDRVVAKALAKEPAARYQTAAELLADLRSLQASWPGAALPALPPPRKPRAPRRYALPAAALAVAAAALAGYLLWRRAPYQPAPNAVRWYQEGAGALRDGTYHKASLALERAVAADPRFALAHARLAEAWGELDYTARARQAMLRAAALDYRRLPQRDVLYIDAVHATLTGDFAGALARLREAAGRAAAPDKADALVDLARAAEKAENPAEALAAYGEATRRDPQHAAAFLRLGVLHGRRQKPAEAAEAFRAAESIYRSLANHEGVVEVLYQRAVLAGRMGRLAEARETLAQAQTLAAGSAHPHQRIAILFQLANLSTAQGDPAASERFAAEGIELARAAGLETLTARGLLQLGNAHFVRGDGEQAGRYFLQTLDFARRNQARRTEASALLSLGSLRIQSGRTAEGIRDVEAAIPFFREGGYAKQSAQALLLLGRARRDQGDYDAAARAFEEQLQAARQAGDAEQAGMAMEGIASVLYQRERFAEAVPLLRERIAGARSRGDRQGAAHSLLLLARAQAALGLFDEARAALSEAAPGVSRPGGYQALSRTLRAVEAELAMAQRRYPEAREHALAALQAAPQPDSETRRLLCLAELHSGARREARRSCAEALEAANRTQQPWLISRALLAQAEALLENGEKSEAAAAARSAAGRFGSAGQLDSEWRALLIAARAAGSADFAAQAARSLAAIASPAYLARPDVRHYRAQLLALLPKGASQ